MHKTQKGQKLTTALGLAAIIFALLCTAACGSSSVSSAKGGMNVVVVSGQAKVRSGGGATPIAEGQEAVIAAGDQLVADEAEVKLLLADGSLLHLSPDTTLQVVALSAEGATKLSQLKGKLKVEAASPLLTVKISTAASDAFVLKTMRFTATPGVRDTTFQLWIDGVNALLSVEAGRVNVTNDARTATVPAGSEVKAIPGGELLISPMGAPGEPTAVAAETTAAIPTVTPDLSRPSPTAAPTATVAPNYLYSAPGLLGPADGSDFKGDETILLIWATPMPLSEDEWYEIQLWREGDVPHRVVQWVKEGTWKVEPQYYPGRYQWRVLIVRGQEGRKERELSPPSQTWGFGWLSPSAPAPAAPTSPPVSGVPVDLTVYLRGTNNAQGFVTLGGEQVEAGTIYTEGGYVYGDVAVRIGDTVYHFDKPKPAPGEPEQLPPPYRMEFKFLDPLANVTKGQPGFNPQKAQFWVGELDCDSAGSPDTPYKIEMTLYAGDEMRKHTTVNFLVADDPSCGGEEKEPEEGGGGEKPPVRP